MDAGEAPEESEATKKEAEKLKAEAVAKDRRVHPSIYLWLKTKVGLISVLLAQKRYEDCADAFAVTRLETQLVND